MKLALTAGLTVTALVLTTGPALASPDDWHETPTGVGALVPYSISAGGGALWTVGAIDTREDSQPVADAGSTGNGRPPFSRPRTAD